MRGIMGARWLLGGYRGIKSVVVFLEREISFVVEESSVDMKLRRWSPLVEIYDFGRSSYSGRVW